MVLTTRSDGVVTQNCDLRNKLPERKQKRKEEKLRERTGERKGTVTKKK